MKNEDYIHSNDYRVTNRRKKNQRSIIESKNKISNIFFVNVLLHLLLSLFTVVQCTR